MVGNLLNRDRVAVMVFDIFQCILRMAGFLLVDDGPTVGELLCQKEKIFIQNAVHHQIAVLCQPVGFGHFLMAETQVVVPEMDDQIIREGSPLQVPFYFNSLHTDPCVGPRCMQVRFIVDQLVRADQESVSFTQAEDLSARLVNSHAIQNIMD